MPNTNHTDRLSAWCSPDERPADQQGQYEGGEPGLIPWCRAWNPSGRRPVETLGRMKRGTSRKPAAGGVPMTDD